MDDLSAMMMSTLFAAALAFGPLQSAPQAVPAPTLPSADTQAAPPAVQAPRQICRLETVTGTNRRTRVCRTLATTTVQDQSTREMMRDMQRPRLPDS